MADSKFNTVQIKQKCLSTKAITLAGGSIIDNSDGSVSVYMPYGPIILTKECCEKLSPNYTFDENTQKCMWGEPINCATNNSYKITLNPINNDGAFFNIGDKETCTLNVEFDYLFKTSCKTLTKLLTNTNSISFVSSETKGKINQLENDIADQEVLCETISGQIITLQTQIENTPYSIVCEVEYTSQPSLGSVPTSTTQSYQNTGFNTTPTAPIDATGSQYSQTQNITGTYCLTETGLLAFETILGVRYTAFINGDPTSYTCDDVTALLDQNTSTNPLVLETCDVPFGFKNQLINDLANLQTQLTNCDSILSQLNNELNTLNANIPLIESACNKPIDFFETLDVSMTVDVISGNTLTTVYEAFDLFSAIGSGNLYKYLSENPNSGFFVSDENGQALKLYSTYVGDCIQIPSLLNNGLMAEAGSITPQEFKNTISDDAFASNWLTYSTTITDPDIIALIADKKIKISLKINNTCGDVCILLDNIKINKDCTKVTKTNIFVTECPGFEIEKIRDNKKSWINNTTLVNRDFKILNTYGDNTIRQTNYNTEDERLILNSKEIDLDINLGAAIETDVWNYVVDNPCILTGETNCFIVFSGCGACYCTGDNKIDFNSLVTQPLSAITVFEDFQYYLTSELIDVKNRQTINSYPTLRALYDRYLSSTAYCDTISSAFDYQTMDRFAGLVGNYWVDIVEQVIPATTIWGSVKVYSNTIFDTQKFKYKSYTTFFCDNPFSGETVPSPINGTSGVTQTVGIEYDIISGNMPTWLTFGGEQGKCGEIKIAQMNFGSEFIGVVSELTTNKITSGNVVNLSSE